jgi:hypothetical protein
MVLIWSSVTAFNGCTICVFAENFSSATIAAFSIGVVHIFNRRSNPQSYNSTLTCPVVLSPWCLLGPPGKDFVYSMMQGQSHPKWLVSGRVEAVFFHQLFLFLRAREDINHVKDPLSLLGPYRGTSSQYNGMAIAVYEARGKEDL